MSKYEPLALFLAGKRGHTLTLTFPEIESIINDVLPKSSFVYREWWSNEVHGSHVQARSWQNAGWMVDRITLTDRTVTFIRTGKS